VQPNARVNRQETAGIPLARREGLWDRGAVVQRKGPSTLHRTVTGKRPDVFPFVMKAPFIRDG